VSSSGVGVDGSTTIDSGEKLARSTDPIEYVSKLRVTVCVTNGPVSCTTTVWAPGAETGTWVEKRLLVQTIADGATGTPSTAMSTLDGAKPTRSPVTSTAHPDAKSSKTTPS